MKRFAYLLIVSLLIGCGGGGGGGDSGSSGSGGDPTQGIPLKTNIIRQMKKGDTWNYSFSGTGSSPGPGGTIYYAPVFGTINISISPDNKTGYTNDNYPFEYTALQICGPADNPDGCGNLECICGNLQYWLSFGQDSSGSISEYGRIFEEFSYNTPSSYNGDPILFKSPMQVGQKYGFTILYDSLVSPINKYEVSVDNIEYVSTGIGFLEAYKLQVKLDLGHDPSFTIYTHYDIKSTIWYVPGLGIVKKIEDRYTYRNGIFSVAYSTTATLDNTTVVY